MYLLLVKNIHNKLTDNVSITHSATSKSCGNTFCFCGPRKKNYISKQETREMAGFLAIDHMGEPSTSGVLVVADQPSPIPYPSPTSSALTPRPTPFPPLYHYCILWRENHLTCTLENLGHMSYHLLYLILRSFCNLILLQKNILY